MIWLLLVAAMSGLMTLALSILPGETFLAFPTGVTTAMNTATSWLSWGLGLTGETLKATYIDALTFWLGLSIALFALDVLRRFSFPIVNKFLR